MTVVVLLPVLARPHRVEPLLASLHESQREVTLRPFFLASPADLGEIEALRASDADFAIMSDHSGPGDWARKINTGYRLTDEDWLLLGADDLAFHPGWADRALERAEATTARVIGTADSPDRRGNAEVRRGSFSPHPLVARSYADDRGGTLDGTGEIVSETYDHNFPDKELALIAQARGEWAFEPTAIVEHLHPHWRKSEMDATYARGLERFREDAVLFRERLKQWRSLEKRASSGSGVRPGRVS